MGCVRICHLFGNPKVNVGHVIFVVGKALEDLRAGQAGKLSGDIVHSGAIHVQTHYIMNCNSRPFDRWPARSNANAKCDVSIGLSKHEVLSLQSATHVCQFVSKIAENRSIRKELPQIPKSARKEKG